jgi:hypothetical protein
MHIENKIKNRIAVPAFVDVTGGENPRISANPDFMNSLNPVYLLIVNFVDILRQLTILFLNF